MLRGALVAALLAGIAWRGYGYVVNILAAILAAILATYLLDLARARRKDVPFPPVNYRSLRLSDAGLEYEPLSRQRFSTDWREIECVEFIRAEAAFPDPFSGPYLETMWLITQRGKAGKVEVMDEGNNRTHLVSAFREFLPGFDMAEAEQAFRSVSEGRWSCFKRPVVRPNRTSSI